MKLFSLRVCQRVEETRESCSFVLEPLANRHPDYRPGQYLSVQIPVETGTIFRSYSFSSSPVAGEPPRITVKREPGGRGSNWLCDNLREGDVINALHPAGDFVPPDLSAPLLLVAGGSGITPVISILKSALLSGSPAIRLVYANRSRDQMIFDEELQAWQTRFPDALSVVHWLDDQQGIPTPEVLREAFGPATFRAVCICGPGVFMDSAVRATQMLGIAADKVFTESFTTEGGSKPESDGTREHNENRPGSESAETVQIDVCRDGQTYQVEGRSDQYLLDVMIDHGLNVPSSCRAGNCGTCLCTLEEGSAILSDNTVLDDEDVEEGWILACRAKPQTERLKVVFP